MHILITGAAGMLGRKLVAKLVEDGEVDHLTLADIVTSLKPVGFSGKITTHAVDISQAETATLLLTDKPDVIFHLAAIVSGDAEENFAKGNAINLDGTRYLLEEARILNDKTGYKPRFVFSSSIAVFGAPLPDVIGDEQRLTPLSSYGTQKAIGELMVADYSRKGFIDGISLRLPTITVRPGLANKAASSFYSGIIREPLNGEEAILPVPRTVRHWFQSPRMAVQNLAHAAKVDTARLPTNRALSLPGVTATVAEMIDALERVGGKDVVALICDEPDERIFKLVSSWPQQFAPALSESLGFVAEKSFDEIISVYLEDEMATS